MLENPQHTPPDSHRAPTTSEKTALADSWRTLVRWKGLTSLDATLKRLNTLFDQYFGTKPSSPWPDQAQRAEMLVVFLRSVRRSTYQEAQTNRASEPLAQRFFGRIDEELRDIIPLLNTEGRLRLFRSCYPLGSGAGSLAHLCVTSELSQCGGKGILTLFSQCHDNALPASAWTEDLLRGANSALCVSSPELLERYLKGLRFVFSPSSSWVPRVNEFFSGMSTTVPLNVLIKMYDYVRPNTCFALAGW